VDGHRHLRRHARPPTAPPRPRLDRSRSLRRHHPPTAAEPGVRSRGGGGGDLPTARRRARPGGDPRTHRRDLRRRPLPRAPRLLRPATRRGRAARRKRRSTAPPQVPAAAGGHLAAAPGDPSAGRHSGGPGGTDLGVSRHRPRPSLAPGRSGPVPGLALPPPLVVFQSRLPCPGGGGHGPRRLPPHHPVVGVLGRELAGVAAIELAPAPAGRGAGRPPHPPGRPRSGLYSLRWPRQVLWPALHPRRHPVVLRRHLGRPLVL